MLSSIEIKEKVRYTQCCHWKAGATSSCIMDLAIIQTTLPCRVTFRGPSQNYTWVMGNGIPV